MKIMHFIHGMSMGGAETLVKDYLMNFDSNENELILLALEKYNTPYEKVIENNNIKTIYINNGIKKNNKSVISKIKNKIVEYNKVKKIIDKENPDILHYHLPLDTYIKYAKPKKNIKIFSTIHNEPKTLYYKSLKGRIELLAAKWLVKNYNMRFIVLHDEMRKEINKIFKVNNSIVVNNGIDFNRFKSNNNKNKNRKKLGIPEDAMVIGHIGRFSYQKNQNFLVEIYNEIYKKNKNSFLLMVGKGSDKDYIINKLKELKLNNYLILEDRTDIPELLSCMDYFVFPSNYEGLGIVLIEAQKMKVPCFKSNKVPEYSNISNIMTTISLEEKPELWAHKILEYKPPKNVVLNDKEWDIKEVVKKLERIYLDKC